MTRHGIERLPVADEKDRLVGIVTRRDLLQVFLRSAEEIWQAVRREVFADALRLSPQISEVAVHDGAVTLTGQLESGTAPPPRGSDAPAGRCRRRRERPHLPLRRQAHKPRTDRARNGRPSRRPRIAPRRVKLPDLPVRVTAGPGPGPRHGPHQRRGHHRGPESTGPGGST
ncbi:CBS domain-containing protein [Streptomyces sp. NPDC002599]|uniref:CBS domain-containing protein n=1 Tax=Streptomyces sp. NPDC002599 TaxID=3154421 RepID=UPI00331A25AE